MGCAFQVDSAQLFVQLLSFFFCVLKFWLLIYSVTDGCILRSLASWVVTVYSYVDIGWYQLFDPAGFIIPDDCIILIQNYIQLRPRPPEDEQGNARNMQKILINVLNVNK